MPPSGQWGEGTKKTPLEDVHITHFETKKKQSRKKSIWAPVLKKWLGTGAQQAEVQKRYQALTWLQTSKLPLEAREKALRGSKDPDPRVIPLSPSRLMYLEIARPWHASFQQLHSSPAGSGPNLILHPISHSANQMPHKAHNKHMEDKTFTAATNSHLAVY